MNKVNIGLLDVQLKEYVGYGLRFNVIQKLRTPKFRMLGIKIGIYRDIKIDGKISTDRFIKAMLTDIMGGGM